MTSTDIREVVNWKPESCECVNTQSTTDHGIEHPLWTMLNTAFSPAQEWRSLGGGVRRGIERTGHILHEHHIPYFHYVQFLRRFGRGGLKRFPMQLTGWKIKKNGAIPILHEFVNTVEYLKTVYIESPAVLEINDSAYRLYPQSYSLGLMKFLYSITAIADALKHKSATEMLRILMASTGMDEFWNGLGEITVKKAADVVDLSAGRNCSEAVKILGREVQIRLGNVAGKPNPDFDRYFKKGGKLNIQGLKIISGEKML